LAAHQAQLAIIFLWSAIPLVQIAWQDDSEKWVSNPRVPPRYKLDKPSTNRMGVGQIITSVKNRGRFSAFGAQIVSTTGLYERYYTIGLRTSSQCLVAASFLVLLSGLFMAAGVIHAALADSFQQPRTRILSAGDSFINHHLGRTPGSRSPSRKPGTEHGLV
jgi:photosystem I P700 chlorophyll a apoprotein A2